jgi:Peptidase C13 family
MSETGMQVDAQDERQPGERSLVPPGSLGAWWKQGFRTVFLRRPDWSGLQTSPAIVTILFLVPVLFGIGVERLYFQGPARFYWQGLAGGWSWTALSLWTCWIHRAVAARAPRATPLNLHRAIRQIAAVMDRREDMFFIHLTSHGARNGELSASFWPLDVDPVTPQLLRSWLDEAGIRNRVISVSACYSGSWIAPLSEPGTLIMTASDSDHTSYGCGSKSELTFFGRAMFDEGLRRTWSFEEAHATARQVIAEREQKAGKPDGYSNPQIFVGERIRARLHLLEIQHAAAGR